MSDVWHELRASLAGPRRRPARWTAPAVAVIAVTVLAGAWSHSRGAIRPVPPTREPPTPTSVAAGTAEPRYDAGVLSWNGARWRVGHAGDRVAVGDWDCDGEPTVALLRPATGTVYRFDAWAGANRDLAPTAVSHVEEAEGLQAVDVDGDGCDELVADTRRGPTVVGRTER